MRRWFVLYVVIVGFSIAGCSSDSSGDDTSYEDMSATYDTLSILGLWEADEEEYDGSYILLGGALYKVEENLVTLYSIKSVECEFDPDIDLTELCDTVEEDAVLMTIDPQ